MSPEALVLSHCSFKVQTRNGARACQQSMTDKQRGIQGKAIQGVYCRGSGILSDGMEKHTRLCTLKHEMPYLRKHAVVGPLRISCIPLNFLTLDFTKNVKGPQNRIQRIMVVSYSKRVSLSSSNQDHATKDRTTSPQDSVRPRLIVSAFISPDLCQSGQARPSGMS